jgi:CheY-like chemotaxis protein
MQDMVLVIEDEDEARTVLMEILELEGFKVRGFANGADALNYLNGADRPCLIVLDILMPVMDGRQFRAALLTDAEMAKIPVVIVTALDPSAAWDLGAVKVLKKPVDIDALLNAVRQNC